MEELTDRLREQVGRVSPVHSLQRYDGRDTDMMQPASARRSGSGHERTSSTELNLDPVLDVGIRM
jgi:hypothetical protein